MLYYVKVCRIETEVLARLVVPHASMKQMRKPCIT